MNEQPAPVADGEQCQVADGDVKSSVARNGVQRAPGAALIGRYEAAGRRLLIAGAEVISQHY